MPEGAHAQACSAQSISFVRSVSTASLASVLLEQVAAALRARGAREPETEQTGGLEVSTLRLNVALPHIGANTDFEQTLHRAPAGAIGAPQARLEPKWRGCLAV